MAKKSPATAGDFLLCLPAACAGRQDETAPKRAIFYFSEKLFEISSDSFSVVTASNERQKQCIDRAIRSLDEGITIIEISEMYDALKVVLDDAEQALLELTGERITDAVVDEVFSNFCVGK